MLAAVVARPLAMLKRPTDKTAAPSAEPRIFSDPKATSSPVEGTTKSSSVKTKSTFADGVKNVIRRVRRAKRTLSDLTNLPDNTTAGNTPVKREKLSTSGTWDLSELSAEVTELSFTTPEGVPDIDGASTDYFHNPAYAKDIMNYLGEMEKKFRLAPNFLENSPAVKPDFRATLVDWLIQVQSHFRLQQDTLHLAVALIDTMLSRKPLRLSQIQLIGITCLLIAAKYIERFGPSIVELCELTDDSYTPDQVIRMERALLNILKFELFIPEPTVFLDRYMNIEDDDSMVRLISMYLLDISLTDITLAATSPSIKAAASLCLARRLADELNNRPGATSWTPSHVFYTGYTERALHPTVNLMSTLLNSISDSKFKSAFNKYAKARYHSISQRLLPEASILV